MPKQKKTTPNKAKPPKTPSKSQDSHLKALAASVGDFIRYWGFRRIHGQLWTQIYLSKVPLSGAELVRSLGVSKALVSPALSELLSFKLIACKEVDGRTKKYSANPEVFEVIRTILQQREKRFIENAQKNYELLQKFESEKYDQNSKVDHDRLDALGAMISTAGFALDFIIKSSENDDPLASWAAADGSLPK